MSLAIKSGGWNRVVLRNESRFTLSCVGGIQRRRDDGHVQSCVHNVDRLEGRSVMVCGDLCHDDLDAAGYRDHVIT